LQNLFQHPYCAPHATEPEMGAFKRESEVRAAMSFNGRRRPVFWINPRVCESLDAYFAERVSSGHGVTAWRSRWRGLVQLGPPEFDTSST
jgi:hypothetical protein